MENLNITKYKIYKVYHDSELLKTFPCPENRIYYDTSKWEWGPYFCEGSIFFDDALDINADYIGLEHYCREFKNIKDNTEMVYEKRDPNNSSITFYYIEKYLDSPILVKQLRELFKQHKWFKEIINSTYCWIRTQRTMFILTKDNFISLRNFVRTSINYLIEQNHWESIDNYLEYCNTLNIDKWVFRGNHRLIAFIIEFLVSTWIITNVPNFIEDRKNYQDANEYYLDIDIVKHCNLNCKGCLHFSPLAEPWYINVEEEFEKWKQIPDFIKRYFRKINIQGGEPLLHPDFKKIALKVKEAFPDNDIIVTTNGILLKDDIISFCNDNNIFINISNYRTKKINKKEIINNSRGIGNWVKLPLNPKGEAIPEKEMAICRRQGQQCFQLVGTHIYACHFEHRVEILNKYFNLNIPQGIGIDVSKISNIEEFIKWKDAPKEICKYCALTASNPTNWELSKKDINEWIV